MMLSFRRCTSLVSHSLSSISAITITSSSFSTGTSRNTSNTILDGLSGTVGRTPLIKLHKLSEETGCTIAVKAEYLNPGGSVKDRAALFLVKDAEERGLLKPGGTVVEGTAGNTGIGLAHICNSRGYKCVIFMPDTQSKEKIDALRVLGAEVFPVPAVPFDNPNNYNHQAKRYADGMDNAIWTNQFDNTANRRAHIETTGPEIWEQTNGAVSAVTFSTGTGGTLAGVGTYLKSKNNDIKVVLADPQGSVLYKWFTEGALERTDGSSITEGIGQGRLTDNLKGAPIDWSILVKDTELVKMTFRLLHEEGFFVGASSGLNVTAAVEVAKTLGSGHTVVTCLCDSGQRYYGRLYNKEWLKEKGLLEAIPEKYRSGLH
ncbi:PREDICTED: cysteine synthase 1-like [Amphimedon queenslandica]|uniref:Cysteine synthase 1 n=1 Tax=Amphimedon queenslandica TaxID=400682 RepID=A0A1X7U4D7_AMPQE|nr:PREDICTED: cysteine synthase 1-like [Amphimedon queenslandica]|eukprot:XP_003389083.2 PREDICTED: cysteine synthase 1-like [Amphimedon queenslandica]